MTDLFRDVFELALRLERIRTAPIPSLPIGFRRRDGPREGKHPTPPLSPRGGVPRGLQRHPAGIDYHSKGLKP